VTFSSVVVLLTVAALVQVLPWLTPRMIYIVLPLAFLSWAIFLVCVWFHPTRGKYGSAGGMFRSAVRWYVALFLGVFSAACAVVSLSHLLRD